jgi:hypothetical protein
MSGSKGGEQQQKNKRRRASRGDRCNKGQTTGDGTGAGVVELIRLRKSRLHCGGRERVVC